MEPVLIAAVAVMTVLMLLSVGILIYIAFQVRESHKELSKLLSETRDELLPAVSDLRNTMHSVDCAAHSAKEKLENAQRIMNSIERIVDGTTLAYLMSKAVKSSGSTLAGVVAGLKEALNVMKKPVSSSSAENTEEDSNKNE